MHGLRQDIAKILVHHKGRAALAGLAVDADDGLILPPQIRWVNGQIGHLPVRIVLLLHHVHTLVDGVLMGAGEGREHQGPGIGVAGVYFQLGAALAHVPDVVHAAEIQLRVHALGIQVHGQVHDIAVAGALPVAEQSALHPLGPGHNPQLSGGSGSAPVVVGVQADNGAVPVLHVPAAVLDLVSIGVGGGHLHSVGQVDDDLVVRGGAQLLQYLVANQHRVLHLRSGEALRGVLIADIGVTVLGNLLSELADELCPLHSNVDDPLHVGVEHHPALEGRGGVVEVDNHVLGPVNGLKSLANQMLSGLDQYLDGDVLWDKVLVNQGPEDFVFRLGSGGEAHLNLLKANVAEHLEELQLLLQVHGIDQSLVAVPQIHAAPDRGFCDGFVRPGAVG